MFLLAKLIGLGGTILSSGTIASFLAPYLQGKGGNMFASWIHRESGSANKYDLSVLKEKAEKNIKELVAEIGKLSSAKEIIFELKQMAYKSISQALDKLTELEEKLTKLYKDIFSQLRQLRAKQAEIFRNTKTKVETEKEKNLIEFLNSGYSQLDSALGRWESLIKEVKCEIDKNCNTILSNIFSWFKSTIPFAPPLESLIGSGGASTGPISQNSGGANLEGSEKAKKGLSEISSELSKLMTEVEQKNGLYRNLWSVSELTKTLTENRFSALKKLLEQLEKQKSSLNVKIKFLLEQSTKLSKNIESINNQLKIWLSGFENLKGLETSLHGWKTKLEESLFQHQGDLERELKLRQ